MCYMKYVHMSMLMCRLYCDVQVCLKDLLKQLLGSVGQVSRDSPGHGEGQVLREKMTVIPVDSEIAGNGLCKVLAAEAALAGSV